MPGPGYQLWHDGLDDPRQLELTLAPGEAMSEQRDLCANCDNWRELHYGSESGIFIGDRALGCVEYQGTVPSPQRRAKKDDELAEGRKHAAAAIRGQPGNPPKGR